MDKTGLINNFIYHVSDEKTWLYEHRISQTGKELSKKQDIICKDLVLIAKEGNIDIILHTEGVLLQNDLDHFTNSPAMKGSLDMAMLELETTVCLVDQVRSPERYKEIDRGHNLPKNRIGGVPKDEARQFFRSHAARLLNQDRSRLSDTEKNILDQRRTNIRAAEKVYKTMQKQALGITNDKSQSRGPSMGL